MNKIQLFGILLIVLGFLFLFIFPFIGILAGNAILLFSFYSGWLLMIIGALHRLWLQQQKF